MQPQVISSLTILFFTILTGCEGASMFALTSNRPKCVIIKSTAGSTIEVIYSTPDLVVLPPDDSSSISLQTRNSLQDPLNSVMDGLGIMRERMKSHQEKRQIMPKKTEKTWHTKTREVVSNLSVTVENLEHKQAAFSSMNSIHDLQNKAQSTQETFLVGKTTGYFRFQLSNYDDVRICVESLTASHLKPNFFSLRVKEIDMNFSEEFHRYKVNEKELERNNREAKEFLTWVERELNRLINRVKSIERGMQAARATHADLHEQSVSMQRTLVWFPCIQFTVTLVTAILLSKSLSKYLKKKRIIF